MSETAPLPVPNQLKAQLQKCKTVRSADVRTTNNWESQRPKRQCSAPGRKENQEKRTEWNRCIDVITTVDVRPPAGTTESLFGSCLFEMTFASKAYGMHKRTHTYNTQRFTT
jgi:hypothetical protein